MSRRNRSKTTTTQTPASSPTSETIDNPFIITSASSRSRPTSATTTTTSSSSLASAIPIYTSTSSISTRHFTSTTQARKRRQRQKKLLESKQSESTTMLDRMRHFFTRSQQPHKRILEQHASIQKMVAQMESKQNTNEMQNDGPACFVCGDPLQTNDQQLYYQCPNDTTGQHQHSQCLTCFGAYIESCCHSYAEQSSFPLKCPIPSCRYHISDQTLRILLSHPENKHIHDIYHDTCIRAGIMDAAINHDVIPVTCQKCNKYTVLLPSNYKARAARLRLLQLKEAEESRIRAETLAKEAKALAERSALAKQTEQRELMHQEMRDAIRARRERIAGELRQQQRDEEVVAIQEPHAFQRLSVSLRNTETGDRTEFDRVRAQTIQQQRQGQEHKQEHDHKEQAASDALPPTSTQFIRQESDGTVLTSLFITCETHDCHMSTCLRCDATVESDDIEHHICSLDRIQELYTEVLDVLAQASVRRCPSCNTPGRKDLSCCHMTCVCGAIWCYVCGARNTTLPGNNFSKHNENWNIGSVTTMCPMYLKYKFAGGNLTNGRYDGDPNRALGRFHMSLQRRAIAEYLTKLSSIDRALFHDMVSLKFPTGIWEAAECTVLDELEAKEVLQRPIEAARLAAAEQARIAAVEQARIQAVLAAEQARIAAEERARVEAEQRARREEEERLRVLEQQRIQREFFERLEAANNAPAGPVPDAPPLDAPYLIPDAPPMFIGIPTAPPLIINIIPPQPQQHQVRPMM